MTEKTPIEPDQIKAGDLIRIEMDPGVERAPFSVDYAADFVAGEYRATRDGSMGGWSPEEGTFYLVHRPERPESPVPTSATLGWLHGTGGLKPQLGVWRQHDYSMRDGVGRAVLQNEREVSVDAVTGFTPAIAISAELESEDLEQLADVFRNEWQAADARGEAGTRTKAALEAVFQVITRSGGLVL